jgi:hypothetical protein
MWLLNKLTHSRGSLKEIFLDEAAYGKEIEAMAIDSAARMARGGVALQLGDVISETEFQTEMDQLRSKVESALAI